MVKFITLHRHGDNKKLHININSIAYIEDMQEGAYLRFWCPSVSSSNNSFSSSLERIHVKESYSQIIFKIEN